MLEPIQRTLYLQFSQVKLAGVSSKTKENMSKKRNKFPSTSINTFIMSRMLTHPSCSKIANKITVKLTLCNKTK